MLIAFCATSLITLVAIALAYLFDIIPTRKHVDNTVTDEELDDGLLNDLDKEILRRRGPFRGLIRTRTEEEANKQFEAIQHFVLTLSDQQIVSGLAIFIIAYSRHCTMFTYHFFIIVALGWFSSTTHLSTLTLLNKYFRDAPALKYTRLLGMFATFIMLFVGLLVLYTDLRFTVRVQCRFHRIFIREGPPLNTICMVLVLGYLVIISLSKSLGFCFSRQGPFSSIRRITSYCVRRGDYQLVSRKDYYVQRLRGVSASQSLLVLRYINAYFLTFNFVYSEFLDSFLWEILWLFFNNIYGIRQTLWARVYVERRVRITEADDEDAWGFGQLLALLLLILPLLAAAEGYRGMWEICLFVYTAYSEFKSDARSKKGQISIPLGSVTQQSGNTRPVVGRGSSSSRLLRPDDDTLSSEEPHRHPLPVSNVSTTLWGLQKDDPYDCPLIWIILIGLFVYTLATMIMVAWYLAWHIGPDYYPGIEASLTMAGSLLCAAIGPIYQDYQGLKYSLERNLALAVD